MAEHLLGNVYQVGGEEITHPMDGASYLIVDPCGKEHMLIDCGSTFGQPELQHQIKQVTELGRVAIVNLTHNHFDHSSAAASMPDTIVRVHQHDVRPMREADPVETFASHYKAPYPHIISPIETIPDGHESSIGGTTITAIHTPGHTLGSMCYKVTTNEGTILLAGDTLWGCYRTRHRYLKEWRESLDKLAQDNFDYVSFGHGISFLIPDAMQHIDLARSCFGVKTEPSQDGSVLDPWAASWTST